MPTIQDIKEILDYNRESGVFKWKKSIKRVKKNDVAGSCGSNGYRRISVCGKRYLAHRLAWLYVYGKEPKELIDHINGIKDDNRICNLREATVSQNAQNQQKAQTRSKVGVLGVSYTKRKRNPYYASLRINGRTVHLGVFPTIEQAHEVYLKNKRIHHEYCEI